MAVCVRLGTQFGSGERVLEAGCCLVNREADRSQAGEIDEIDVEIEGGIEMCV
jgi:hypothetical protein